MAVFSSFLPHFALGQDPHAGLTRRVPPFSDGVLDNESGRPRITPDGRFVVFESRAEPDPLAPTTHARRAIYRLDRSTNTVLLVSRKPGAGGAVPSTHCFNPSVSDDGMRIAFETAAQLVPADTNFLTDIYVRKLDDNNDTVWLSVRRSGGIVQPNGSSTQAFISGDGGFVAFSSVASNLTPLDANGALRDVFRADVNFLGDPLVVSRDNGGVQSTTANFFTDTGRTISADGFRIVFRGTPCDWNAGPGGSANSLCPDPDNNCTPCSGVDQVYLWEDTFPVNTTHRVSRVSSGASFSAGNGASKSPSISADNDDIVYSSTATNFPGDTDTTEDVFQSFTGGLEALEANPQRISVPLAGSSNGASTAPMTDGVFFVVFHSAASNLVSGDTNGQTDVFLRDTHLHTTFRFSVTPANGQSAGGSSTFPDVCTRSDTITPNRELIVVYDSAATNLDPLDANGKRDIFESRSRHFRRGDFNQDGVLTDTEDRAMLSAFLFAGGPAPACMDTADADNNGAIDNTDALLLADAVDGTPRLAPPDAFLGCGLDQVVDALSCGTYNITSGSCGP